jgi:hypothetical protein
MKESVCNLPFTGRHLWTGLLAADGGAIFKLVKDWSDKQPKDTEMLNS